MSVLDIEGILEILPHRYPFLLIDRVIEYEEGARLVAIKNVTINEPFFCGHFPERPVMPGVLILEALAQASVLLSNYEAHHAKGKKYMHFFAAIDNARFKQMVVPGDQLRLEIGNIRHKRNFWKMHGEATVDGKLVCSADLMSATEEIKE
ncbi:MAG: 3-hydroxyacyl-ACP dehydratase FabZ [Gammaproteobacteria bacterium]